METGSTASAAVILVIMEVGKTLGHHSMRTVNLHHSKGTRTGQAPEPQAICHTMVCRGLSSHTGQGEASGGMEAQERDTARGHTTVS